MHIEGHLPPLSVHSRQGIYEVHFVPTVAEATRAVVTDTSDLLVVCDERVAALHSERLRHLLTTARVFLVPANEETKSFVGVGALVDWLIQQRAVRSSSLLAIGGGCIQDLVSFTSHIYYRGIEWSFLPTTVLSQADSCIGAKSGINVLPFKNQLGVLHSPARVVICAEFLETLPEIEVASGYGEIVKLAVTSSRSFLARLEGALASGGIRNDHLLELTRASLAAKQEIIEQDEYESDLRRILNYGHSFGHALEAATGHVVPHGLGVLWGIDVINWLGVRWGVTSPTVAERMALLTRRYFDYKLPLDPVAADLIEMVSRDKKVAAGYMHFAVLEDEGRILMVPQPLDEAFEALVSEYLESDYVFRRS